MVIVIVNSESTQSPSLWKYPEATSQALDKPKVAKGTLPRGADDATPTIQKFTPQIQKALTFTALMVREVE